MPAPPPKPPPRPGGPAAGKAAASGEDVIARARREKDELERETQAVEEELEALRARYDQYFLGLERREPSRWREELKRKVLRTKGAFTRNTGLRFRIQSLHARFISYERLWLRGAREKEDGTYGRDLFKARLHRRREEERARRAAAGPPREEGVPAASPLAPALPPHGPSAAAPAPAVAAAASPPVAPAKPGAARPVAAPPPPPAAGISDAQMRTLYNAYLAAKMTCREDVSRLTYEAVARSVSKQIPELLTRYRARSIEFKVEVKEGRAVLKAIPKL